MSAKTAGCYGSGAGLTDCGEGMASMNARWANPGDTGPIALERVQQSLTVDMVMTPRADLQTCRRDETASEVMVRNTKMFSFL